MAILLKSCGRAVNSRHTLFLNVDDEASYFRTGSLKINIFIILLVKMSTLCTLLIMSTILDDP